MEFVNSKGVRWYLHKKLVTIGRNKIQTLAYFFKKEKTEGYCSLPIGYKVMETNSGMPIPKKI